MSTEGARHVRWRRAEVTSPRIGQRVPVVVAEDIPYFPAANRFQTLSIYLPRTPETLELVGTEAECLRVADPDSAGPRYHVHILGAPGATPSSLRRRSSRPSHTPSLIRRSRSPPAPPSITGSRSSPHPHLHYDALKENHSDPAREATHPGHVSDVLHGLALLRSFGLTDHSYILSGHSCGARIAFQAILQAPLHHGLELPDAPCPAALLGLNGLYALPELTDGLGASHEHLREEYRTLLSNAFTAERKTRAPVINLRPAAA